MFSLLVSDKSNAQQQCLKVGYWEASSHQALVEMLKDIYREAKICASFEKLPLKRAEVELLNNDIDANGWRSQTFIQKFSEKLTYTEEPFFTVVNLIIYDPLIVKEQDLAGKFKNIEIGNWRGDADGERNIRAMGAVPVNFTSREHLYSIFNEKRIPAFFISALKENIEDFKRNIHTKYAVLQLKETKFYHVLYKDNEKYLRPLNGALKRIKKRLRNQKR